ncbi:MAG: c-type cytochrome [Crocinitomicaceae bacterium]|nr:c-type cytochrome [Crocinitomicaceae bacterium]
MMKTNFFNNTISRMKMASINKIKKNLKFTPLALLIGAMMIDNQALALSFSESGNTENLPWLLVENSDILFLVIINIILLGVFLYLKGMFNNLLNIFASSSKEKETKTTGTFSKMLTDAVPVEDEDKIMMDHDFDGIRELDNNLPPWWVAMLIATMIFAVVYIFHYHVFGTGDLQLAEYNKEMEKADAEVKEYLTKNAMNVDETNATVMKDSKDLAVGKDLFDANCIMCHKEKGEGDIGPNLTDEFWIYTGDIKAIYKSIKIGTSNGMPEHASKLNPIQIQQVASYVYSLPYTPGKEPQGEKYVKE